MSKEVDMRAADGDRQQIADQLKSALDEGRLSLHEYDERVASAYAARTYGDLLVLVQDLPRPGMTNAEVKAQARKAARRLPTALLVLWTIWGALVAVNVVVYALVAVSITDFVYPWPFWLLVPGVALGAVTVGVQVIRDQNGKQ
ncbi:DUF1707 SHOCT-like domain-containing protein [Actinoplanes sp. G11-F43]|uniref:DUF1707 SHOCT-like domain-containing protein n=1 Tax=Actinoplanes sp. G11-F43 TaxID=3424130 RepID=UPI003D345EBF